MSPSARDAEQIRRALRELLAAYPITGADLHHVAREGCGIVSTAPIADPDDPVCWPFYHVFAADVRMLLSVLPKSYPEPHESPAFRQQVLRVIRYLYLSGQCGPGYTMARTIRNEWQAALGADDPDVLDAADKLASCAYGLEKYAEARDLWERVMDERGRILGPDHPDTLMAGNNLGISLSAQGEYRKACVLLTDIRRRSRNPDRKTSRVSTLAASNLANCLFQLGDFQGAREAHENALRQCVQAVGQDHPLALRITGELTQTLHKLGEHKAARVLHKENRKRIKQVRRAEAKAKEQGPGASRSPYFNPDVAKAGFFGRLVGNSIVAVYAVVFCVIIGGNLAALVVGGVYGAFLGVFICVGIGVIFCLFDIVDVIRMTGGIRLNELGSAADFWSAAGMVCFGVILGVTLSTYHIIGLIAGMGIGSIIGMVGSFFGADTLDVVIEGAEAVIALPARIMVGFRRAGRRRGH